MEFYLGRMIFFNDVNKKVTGTLMAQFPENEPNTAAHHFSRPQLVLSFIFNFLLNLTFSFGISVPVFDVFFCLFFLSLSISLFPCPVVVSGLGHGRIIACTHNALVPILFLLPFCYVFMIM